MGEQSRLEENKRIVKLSYDYYNNREWEKFADLLHEDLNREKNIPDTDGYQKRNQVLRQKFMEAIFDVKTKEMMKEKWKKIHAVMEKSAKDGILAAEKSAAESEEIQRKIIRMISEGEEVWVKERRSGTGFYENAQYDYEIDNIFFLKEGKIIDMHRLEDNFTFYMQLGGLKARTDNKEDLVEYLDSLKELGLIPENVGVTD